VEASRRIHLEVTAVFADEDGNGVQDDEESSMTNVRFRFLDESGRDVVDPHTGSSWTFDATVDLGDYLLLVFPEDWFSPPPGSMPRHVPVYVGPGDGSLTIDKGAIGLLPHRTSAFFPVMARNGDLGD
jgi:hypothetical protein